MKTLLVKSQTTPGRRFGRLVILGQPFHVRMGATRPYCFAVFQCDCGNVTACNLNCVSRGITRSCGCLHVDSTRERNRARATHGLSRNRLHRIWSGMVRRCHDPRCAAFRYYGAKGVAVCGEWRESLPAFASWALANGYSDELTIDRIKSSGNYEPENCRWATMEEQENNRSDNVWVTIGGETKTVSQWSRDSRCRAAHCTIRGRIRRGWNPVKAIMTPAAHPQMATYRRSFW